MEKLWVFGKVEPGWYCAMGRWDAEWAKHLESLGYQVQRSINKPEVAL